MENEGRMKFVVITPHPDDYTYGVAGTLLTHADVERHVIVVAPIQLDATREVARRLGVELHLLDATFHKIAESEASVKQQLTKLLEDIRPDYVFGPPIVGDWSPDHLITGRLAHEAYLDSGSYGQWNARYLRFPIPASTTKFTANVYVDLPKELIDVKMELAAAMTRGAEDIWPRDVVEWEIKSQHRFANEVGWPSVHVEGFDAIYPIPWQRLPPRDSSQSHLQDEHLRKIAALTAGGDLSKGAG
jgi:LmbE family N-acetylglucosaminyl deacetylase